MSGLWMPGWCCEFLGISMIESGITLLGEVNMDVSIVIPVYNEAQSLPILQGSDLHCDV